MGIHGLSKVIGDHAARAVKECEIKAYEGESWGEENEKVLPLPSPSSLLPTFPLSRPKDCD